jgi:hypothetical protein
MHKLSHERPGQSWHDLACRQYSGQYIQRSGGAHSEQTVRHVRSTAGDRMPYGESEPNR